MNPIPLTTPLPCPFCGGTMLEINAIVFRAWFVHCNQCCSKGPEGKTPDAAVRGWNSYKNNHLQQRKNIDMSKVDNTKIDKIWRACRALRTFTVTEVRRITEIEHRATVRTYIYWLEKRGYLRIEGQKNKPGAPNVYRIVHSQTVNAPGWTQLRYPEADKAMRRENVRHMKPIKVSAAQ